MSKDIVFSHSTAKGCWVSEEIAQASMAYIQVTRKEPGFLRVYTYAEGQRPVLAHATQEANAVVFADYQPADVRLLLESETEVTSAVVCQDSTGASGGGDSGASSEEVEALKERMGSAETTIASLSGRTESVEQAQATTAASVTQLESRTEALESRMKTAVLTAAKYKTLVDAGTAAEDTVYYIKG